MRLKFDALMSHDITYVGIIQTVRASGIKQFPIPYVMTNCHNSLCAVGGTINEDDHAFGLSAAKKYGGIYVPANIAVCHQYIREKLTSCGNMILGSDSHTRYGCYGTMGIGEGGGELAKQLLGNTYDLDAPEVVLVWLEGSPGKGVGPHDVAISLCREVFADGLVKNKVLEFAGPGVKDLPMDFRIGIDVMTTETSCLTSIWVTDEKVKEYFDMVGRPEAFRELKPADIAYYDSMITIDLSEQECMIALPFHPSNAYTIRELQADPVGILSKVQEECNRSLDGQVELKLTEKIADGKVFADQGIIVGCSGGMYDNLAEAAAILDGAGTGSGLFNLSVYPASAPINLAITKDHIAETLMRTGAVIKPAFCGPCFGAGDTPSHNALSIRHATRNFPNREGSKPGEGQISAVALMDARSIAATALNGGIITAATDIDWEPNTHKYVYDDTIYQKGFTTDLIIRIRTRNLRWGRILPNWPKFFALGENLLMKLAAVIHDDVTTTDELIPSGETSSYRSNPIRLSEFALSEGRRNTLSCPKRYANLTGGAETEISPLKCLRFCPAYRLIPLPFQKRPMSFPAYSPENPVTAARANRPLPVRKCSAAGRTSAMNTRPNATAATASTGVSSLSPSAAATRLCMMLVLIYSYRIFGKRSAPAERIFPQK
jgi:aconitate hydratase